MSDSLPPSVLNAPTSWLPDHWGSWAILIIMLCFLIYTLKVVSQEKQKFFEDGQWIVWKSFQFFIPAWWSQKSSTENGLSFYRADTHYDWFFSLAYFPHEKLSDVKERYLQQHQIILDEDAVITQNAEFLIQDQSVLNTIEHFYRIESTATEKQEDRIYLDAVWLELHQGHVLQLISRSSVLNGGIEGPYVEEVIKAMKMNS